MQLDLIKIRAQSGVDPNLLPRVRLDAGIVIFHALHRLRKVQEVESSLLAPEKPRQ